MKKAKVLWIVTLSLLGLLTIGFAAYMIVFYFSGYKPLEVFIISLIYVFLAYGLSIALSLLYRWQAEIQERIDSNKRNFGVDSYFNTKLSFSASIGRRAMKNNLAQGVRAKAEATALAQRIKDKAAGKDVPGEEEVKKQFAKVASGAVIAFSVFSDTEEYQYFQLKKIREFYGVIIKYLEAMMKQKDYRKKMEAGYESHVFYLYYAYKDEADLQAFTGKIESDLYTLFEQCEIGVNMHPSFGIYDIDGKSPDVFDMVEKASASLRLAINSYQVFVYYSEEVTSESIHNDVLEKEIKRAIANKEFKVYYQGKFDLSMEKFVGAEALIRWQHPEKGLFNPSAFIGEFEKSGLIHVIDFYVFDQVCQDLADWKKRGRRMIPVSVNFSSYDFYRPDFIQSIQQTLDKYNIATNYIEIEITESSTANNFFSVMAVLKQLKDMNIRILMDDFGTGFSSLGNLEKYPISGIKIDKSFIDQMMEDVKSKEIVSTIVTLARSLSLQSIAEGVQTEGQVEMLKGMKCNVVQGYYYSKPMMKKDFEIFLATNQFEKKGILL
jgi:EAL domain-containing protein (putative c-di-GMP-specific phosphodiesterase class I)